jgi:micrococcal nuclease
MKQLAIILSVFMIPVYAHPVIKIIDGDTLTLLIDKKPVKIRFSDIDAPEKTQPFYSRSKDSLAELCWGKDVIINARGNDRFGRPVATVYCDGVNVNRVQVDRGMAWVHPSLPSLEVAARRQQLGLWQDPYPVAPWIFRRELRQ